MNDQYQNQPGQPMAPPQQQGPQAAPQQAPVQQQPMQPPGPQPMQQGPAPVQTQTYGIDPNMVPDYIRNRQRPASHNALDAGAGGGGPRLSIKGKQFRFIENDQERVHPFGQPLYVTILATDPETGLAKNYYGGQSYQEGVDQIPICYSADGVTPDAGCEQPQSSHCATCPHNQFGTARNQDGTIGKGKACRDFKRVYVLPYDSPTGEPYELRVPPTSFKNMQSYGGQLAKAGAEPFEVVTVLNFTADTSPVLTFNCWGFHDAQTADLIRQKLEAGVMDTIRPSLLKSPAQVTGQAALPATGGQAQLPGPSAPPQQQPSQQPPAQQPPQQAPQQPPVQQPQAQGGPTPPPGPVAPPQQQQPPQPPQAAPCPLGAPQGYQMTEKAGGQRYEAFTGAGWSDDLLVQHGYMVRV